MNALRMPSAPIQLRRYIPIQGSIFDLASSRETTASELKMRIDDRRIAMESLGLKQGQRVFLETSNSVDFFVDFFAISEVGAVSFVIDSSQTLSEKDALRDRISPHYLIDSNHKISVGDGRVRSSLPHDAAFVLFTSGTTAKPKAVIHTYSNIRARMESGARAIPFEQRARALTLLPLHFAHGFISMCLSTLFVGETLYLPPSVSVESFALVSKWVQELNISFISGTPVTWNFILKFSKDPAASSLRRVQIASAHSGFELFEKIRKWSGAQVWNVYGLTEGASWISDYRVEKPGDELIIGDGKSWNTQFEIHDPDEKGVGEIVFRSASLFAGYWDSGAGPEVSQVFETRDLGRMDSEGRIHLSGRMGRVINRGGIKVSPEEVEIEIRKHPSVEDVFVLADLDEGNGEGIGALLVLRDKANPRLELQAIQLSVVKHISSYKVPTKWIVVPSIPRRTNGKPDLVQIGSLWKAVRTES